MRAKIRDKVNTFVLWLDQRQLLWVVFVMSFVIAIPFLRLGEGSVFVIHDQLDESILNYIMPARHLGEAYFPEIMCGIRASGMEPSAVIFPFLFRMFSPFRAFLICYYFVFIVAFLGMYLLMKEITQSSILSTLTAGLFCMLPYYVVYGLSVAGIPLVAYAFLCLAKAKNKVISLGLIAIFALSSHLVYTGYIVLGFVGIILPVFLILKRKIGWILAGFTELTVIYLLINRRLLQELLFDREVFVSHREEFVNYPLPFTRAVADLLLNGQYHVPSLHLYLILPICILLVVSAFFYRRLDKRAQYCYITAVGIMILILLIALFYGLCRMELVTDWKNRQTGFLHSFQIDRLYWLYPTLWYLECGLLLSVIWIPCRSCAEGGTARLIRGNLAIVLAGMALVLLPTVNYIIKNSIYYMNVNQYNNGSEITSYISWESYFAEDLMSEVDKAIGRERKDYRIAHIGMNTAPALAYGFYTIDGYSNNYSLEYKHRFRKIIEKELDKDPVIKNYFDNWGSRCYLFNSVTGSDWNISKNATVQYSGLEFDMDEMKQLGCEYLFSAGEILDPDNMGVELIGYFETETSIWGIWLYRIV